MNFPRWAKSCGNSLLLQAQIQKKYKIIYGGLAIHKDGVIVCSCRQKYRNKITQIRRQIQNINEDHAINEDGVRSCGNSLLPVRKSNLMHTQIETNTCSTTSNTFAFQFVDQTNSEKIFQTLTQMHLNDLFNSIEVLSQACLYFSCTFPYVCLLW